MSDIPFHGHPVRLVEPGNELAPDLNHCAASGEFVLLQLESGEILWVVPSDGLAELAAIMADEELRELLAASVQDVSPDATRPLSEADIGTLLRQDEDMERLLGQACLEARDARGQTARPGWRPDPPTN